MNRNQFVGLGLILTCALTGCGSSNTVSLPENATAEPPAIEASQGGQGAKGESKGGETQKIKPR